MKKKPQQVPPAKIQAPVIKKQVPKRSSSFSWGDYKIYFEFFAVLALVLITYGNSINNDYNLDDGYVVSLDNANPLTKKGISGIPEIFTTKYNAVEGLNYGYRPLGRVTMAIEYSFFGNDPHVSHFINVLLFAITCFLLLLFIQQIANMLSYKNPSVIYLSVFLFIIHPIHTEVVCSIKNREEILSFLFMLAGLLCYKQFIRKNRQWWQIPGFIVFIALAVFSKQTAFNVMGVIFLISIFQFLLKPSEEPARFAQIVKGILTRQTLVFLIIAAVVLYYIVSYIPKSISEDTFMRSFEHDPLYYFSGSHLLGNATQTILFYLRKLLVPFPLLFYYGYDMLPDRGWLSVFPYIGILSFAGLGYLLWYAYKKKSEFFLLFWVFFFCVTIFPFSNLGVAQYVTGIVGERLVFQASAGFCAVLSILFYWLAMTAKKRWLQSSVISVNRLAWYMAIVVILPYFILTVTRNTQWKDKITLYEHDMPFLNRSARANFMMASTMMMNLKNNQLNKAEVVEKARNYLYQAVHVSPKYSEVWIGLATLYSQQIGRTDSALACLSRVDTADSRQYQKALMVYGDIYQFDSLNNIKALGYYKQSFFTDTSSQALYGRIAMILTKEHMYDSLLLFSEIGIKKHWPEAYISKGDVYFRRQDTATAVLYYQEAIDRGLRPPKLLKNLKYYYKLHKQFDKLNSLPR